MSRHLSSCSARQAAIAEAEKGRRKEETLYHLRVQDAHGGDFWLDIEMPGSSTLGDLDGYLRAIWLECCGHMSQFSTRGWGSDEVPTTREIGQVFEPGVELTHIYDFGTESVTLVKCVATREGKPMTEHPVALMARNLMPQVPCIKCDRTAAWLCMECVIEHNTWGLLCDEHAKKHHHRQYGKPIALVNSPRLGMCGYTGPAEPPY